MENVKSSIANCYVFKLRRKIVYHVDDLHERNSEAYLNRFGLVGNRSLQNVVFVKKMMQQFLLIGSTERACQRD